MKKIYGYLVRVRKKKVVWDLFGRTGSRVMLVAGFLLFMVLDASGQQLSGVVRDRQSREPLAGVSLSSVKTGRVFLSGEDGRVSFVASLGDTLVVTYLGYKTRRVAVGQVSLLEILLETDQSVLGEVNIYTGYQRIPRERATGSFTLIDEKLFSQQVGTTILDRLPNIAVGVSLDRRTVTPSLSVRGLSTMQGPRSPLIILDNFPYQGSLENLNPNEVESISILKDAAAVSIWGARAGNGVIVMTSKKAKFNQGLNFSLTSN
ncbi:TonB-dependent receptor plug domain-containing protein, partial [Anabaena sp. AL93]|uniref:TonB-dependent receptor plug domain-containing protein n=1 Tax=Anabaena sp. AL93 TaxID=1678133 RepID=UPI0007FCD2C6